MYIRGIEGFWILTKWGMVKWFRNDFKPTIAWYLNGFTALHGFPCGISGRPSSMYMWCPHDIGRDSWEWVEHKSLQEHDSFPPKKWGKKPLTEWIPVSV